MYSIDFFVINMRKLARLNKDDIVPMGVIGWGISMEMGLVQKTKQN
jgi:hypothetical protein